MVKCTHCGNAAAAGLEAAQLARRGFTSHPGIFDAPHGYVATFFPQHFDYRAGLLQCPKSPGFRRPRRNCLQERAWLYAGLLLPH